ncbi:MAG: hypothetical protein ACLGI8_10130 [Acidimicrobiia bacterium]|jgi:hypothetical protein
MSEAIDAPAPGHGRQAEPIDLTVLERIEGELDAVERALEQIDQGVYDGFSGLGEVPDDGGLAGYA